MSDLRIGSACSGYGGLDLGLMSVVGGSVAWHVENAKHPSVVLDARFPGVPNYGDLTTVDWTQVEPVDWFTAGYPCQPFSHAGKRRGSKDERHLWPYIAGAIGVLRPRRVVLENVAGHVSLGLDTVLWDLAALGYDAVWGVVRAADAGAPHNRARVFIVASDTRRERYGSREDGRSVGRVDGADAGETREWERPRPIANDRSAAVDADTNHGAADGERPRAEPRRGGEAPRDADIAHTQGGQFGSARTWCGQGSVGGSGDVAADPDEQRRERGWRPRHRLDGPADNDLESALDWGTYERSVRRWEAVTKRPAPRPTEPGRSGERLSSRFVEWMMGLPDGWVTDVLSRNPALKCLGNGVVPQQAALALRLLLPLTEREVAA